MWERLACSLGRNDEAPNVELAKELLAKRDTADIAEMAAGLREKNKAVANDCIKVLYEIGAGDPALIADYTADFLDLLGSRDNRMVWGAMTALGQVTALRPDVVFARLSDVVKAYEKGSVITVDNAISVLAHLCVAGPHYAKSVFPILLRHLETCRPKEIPQHAQRMAVCIHRHNQADFWAVLARREALLTAAQQSRIQKLKRQLA